MVTSCSVKNVVCCLNVSSPHISYILSCYILLTPVPEEQEQPDQLTQILNKYLITES